MPIGIYPHKCQPASERFWGKVKKHPNGCWEWQGSITPNGYGQFWHDNRLIQAHRFAYEQLHGSLPKGLLLFHSCRNRKCVNPEHLEALPQSVISRQVRAAKPQWLNTTAIERFLEKIAISGSGCWEWQAYVDKGGYGKFGRLYAHRWSYEYFKGRIPDGHHLDHLCQNRKCVNPDHLEAVLPKVNVMRGRGLTAENARRTHCVNGHLLDEQNTYVYQGQRHCIACLRDRTRRYRRQEAEINNEKAELVTDLAGSAEGGEV